jgi:hypothetical protein
MQKVGHLFPPTEYDSKAAPCGQNFYSKVMISKYYKHRIPSVTASAASVALAAAKAMTIEYISPIRKNNIATVAASAAATSKCPTSTNSSTLH